VSVFLYFRINLSNLVKLFCELGHFYTFNLALFFIQIVSFFISICLILFIILLIQSFYVKASPDLVTFHFVFLVSFFVLIK